MPDQVSIQGVAKAALPAVIVKNRAQFCRVDLVVGCIFPVGDQHDALTDFRIPPKPIAELMGRGDPDAFEIWDWHGGWLKRLLRVGLSDPITSNLIHEPPHACPDQRNQSRIEGRGKTEGAQWR